MKKYYSVDEKRGSHASPFSKTRRQIDERRMAESLTAIVGAARTTKLMVTTARGQRCGGEGERRRAARATAAVATGDVACCTIESYGAINKVPWPA